MSRARPVALLLALGALCAPAATAADREVAVSNFRYSPAYVRIDPGEAVIWRVRDGSSHTMTTRRSAPQAFDSGDKEPGETFAFTFTKPGRYDYFCTIHPGLGQEGVVQVGPDEVKPRLSRLRARRVRRAVRVSFVLSEDAQVLVRLRRAGRRAGSVTTDVLRDGRASLVLRPRRPGAYRLSAVATDREGNVSKLRRARFTLPRPRR